MLYVKAWYIYCGFLNTWVSSSMQCSLVDWKCTMLKNHISSLFFNVFFYFLEIQLHYSIMYDDDLTVFINFTVSVNYLNYNFIMYRCVFSDLHGSNGDAWRGTIHQVPVQEAWDCCRCCLLHPNTGQPEIHWQLLYWWGCAQGCWSNRPWSIRL